MRLLISSRRRSFWIKISIAVAIFFSFGLYVFRDMIYISKPEVSLPIFRCANRYLYVVFEIYINASHLRLDSHMIDARWRVSLRRVKLRFHGVFISSTLACVKYVRFNWCSAKRLKQVFNMKDVTINHRNFRLISSSNIIPLSGIFSPLPMPVSSRVLLLLPYRILRSNKWWRLKVDRLKSYSDLTNGMITTINIEI